MREFSYAKMRIGLDGSVGMIASSSLMGSLVDEICNKSFFGGELEVVRQ